ncbi:hypothetical protein [Microlunatus sp. Gsoil 973]|uniref:hypothetical protein n=1 Tax=Microlunatus sp. Gsoil 973 TaxID=2672569 RepID=UPI0012B493A3|nr:hypothetical protein [Microlunatus sp. Gsoil 973]QGN34470.1 hypothetical protein GJV80_18475 [Microlunatus sp. Gsoil 973]
MKWIVRSLGALLVAVLVAHVAFHLGSSAPQPRGPGFGVSAPRTKQHTQPSPVVVSTDPAPDWETTTQQFVQAFLDHSRTRSVRLRSVATPRLATLLARTDPAKIPDGRPVGEPRAVAETHETVTVAQQLSDGSAIALDLVPDPTRAAGWVVTSVRPGAR